jgi:DNA-binding NtrC family response regulator
MSSHFAEGSLFDLESSSKRLVLRDLLATFEASLIVTALLAAGGSQKRAAIALGVLPTTLQQKLKRLGFVHPRPGSRARREGRGSAPDVRSTPHLEAPPTSQEI